MSESGQKGYELADAKPRVNLPGDVIVCNTPEELVDQMGHDLVSHSLNCLRSFGDFHMAVSGGTTLTPFLRHLMIDPICRGIPWKRTHLWMADERRVAPDDDQSHWHDLHDHLGLHAGIPTSQQHRMDAMSRRVEKEYADELRSALAWREKGQDRLDYVLLGLGEDGHTAGLFAHSPALAEQREFVRINSGPTVPGPDRVTMTRRILNGARFIAIMVTGERKAPIVERLTHRDAHPQEFPVLALQPTGGTVRWYLDRAATGG